MQSFFDKRGPRLDTSLPSVRHLQELIRNRTPVSVLVQGGVELEGTIRWQDMTYLAIGQEGRPPTLVNLAAMITLRTLG